MRSNVGEEGWRVFDSSQQPERFQEHNCQLYNRAALFVVTADLVRVVIVTRLPCYCVLQWVQTKVFPLLLLNLFSIHGLKMFH